MCSFALLLPRSNSLQIIMDIKKSCWINKVVPNCYQIVFVLMLIFHFSKYIDSINKTNSLIIMYGWSSGYS